MVADGGEDGRERTHDLIVGEAEDGPAEAFDGLLAVIIVQLLVVFIVNPPVEFDDQLQGDAGEVGEVAVDRVLATESQAAEPAGAQVLPENSLGVGLAPTKVASAGGPGLGRHAA